jgi:hypothetical protein
MCRVACSSHPSIKHPNDFRGRTQIQELFTAQFSQLSWCFLSVRSVYSLYSSQTSSIYVFFFLRRERNCKRINSNLKRTVSGSFRYRIWNLTCQVFVGRSVWTDRRQLHLPPDGIVFCISKQFQLSVMSVPLGIGLCRLETEAL